jgi:transcriptional regulator with XRE-family HTH domain
MDERRVGRALRVLRRARSLRQRDVAAAAGVSQPTVSAIERGHWSGTSLRTLCEVFDVVDADVHVLVRFRRGELDRLLDEGHAAVVAAVATMLRDCGWLVELEVSFNHYGDRGSIDVLAYHPATRTLLVVEVKTEITSAEETLRRLDVKIRIAPLIAPDRFGEAPTRVVRLLAIRASTANRDRVTRLDSLFGSAFPLRGRQFASWLRSPGTIVDGRGSALMFVRGIDQANGTHGTRRVRVRASPAGSPRRA